MCLKPSRQQLNACTHCFETEFSAALQCFSCYGCSHQPTKHADRPSAVQVSAGTCVVLAETLSSNTALDAVILQVCLFVCFAFNTVLPNLPCVFACLQSCICFLCACDSECVLPVCVLNVCTCLQDNPLGALGVQKLLKAVHEGMCLFVCGCFV
jgi:hypothetical protein